MIHQCQIHCHALRPEDAEIMNIKDEGRWLPFAFDLDIVSAVKMTTDDEAELVYGCTTLFTASGETYIIDTPYEEFIKIFMEYHFSVDFETDQDDLEL
jgi:hypothetical protein